MPEDGHWPDLLAPLPQTHLTAWERNKHVHKKTALRGYGTMRSDATSRVKMVFV